MFLDGLDIARVVELTEAVAEVSYTRQDEFLGIDQSVFASIKSALLGECSFGGV